MMKKSLCIAALIAASSQVMANNPIQMEVPFDKTSFCIYEGTAYTQGSVVKVKDSKQVLTCIKQSTGAYWQ